MLKYIAINVSSVITISKYNSPYEVYSLLMSVGDSILLDRLLKNHYGVLNVMRYIWGDTSEYVWSYSVS